MDQGTNRLVSAAPLLQMTPADTTKRYNAYDNYQPAC